MSTDLHRTMLYFKGHTLIAKSDAVEVHLDSLPTIDALPKNTTEIHFYPALCEYEIVEKGRPKRPMRPPEMEAVLRFLRKVSDFGCGLFRRNP